MGAGYMSVVGKASGARTVFAMTVFIACGALGVGCSAGGSATTSGVASGSKECN
jgi:hypothetical protein